MQTFRIIRADRQSDTSMLVAESLLIGRARASDLQLAHPTVAALQAGIKWHEGAFWLTRLADTADSPVWLNGAAVQQAPLGEGDQVRIGPYLLSLSVRPETLQLTVELVLGLLSAEQPAAASPSSIGTPADQRILERYWERRLQTVEARFKQREGATPTRPAAVAARSQRSAVRLLAGSGLIFLLGLAVAAGAYPQLFAPGPLSQAHASKTLPVASAIASQASSACRACHTLSGSMAARCITCHSTNTFQATLARPHLSPALTCRTCHTEHRGRAFEPALVSNAVCTGCHQIRPPASQPAAGQGGLHGPAVSYPVRNGRWSWEGLSQKQWQAHGLPGSTLDYNLREQFHLLHTQGRAQGRALCADCHLGGVQSDALKQPVRAACAQCHSLQPALAAALLKLAETQPLPAGQTLCVSCHAQHGAEKDLRASVRK